MERRPIFSYPKPFLFGSNMTKTDGKGVHAPDAEAEATAAALRRLAATHAAQQAERSMRQEELQQHLEEAQERLRICREMQHSEAHQALHRYRQDESEVERLQLEMAQASAGSLEAPEAAPMPVLPSEELPHGVSMVGPVVSNSCAVTGSPSSSPRSSDCRERFPVWAQAAPVPKLEQKEIQLFYSQVHPLQQGVRLRAATSPQQNFEEKTLVLSSDFQRLELWPSTVRGPARRRIADSFLRLEALSRAGTQRFLGHGSTVMQYLNVFEGWLDKGAQLTNAESRIEDRESRIEDRGSRIENRGSRIEDRESRAENGKSRIENRGSRLWIENRESRIENGESRTRIENQNFVDESFHMITVEEWTDKIGYTNLHWHGARLSQGGAPPRSQPETLFSGAPDSWPGS
eukprot:s282_g41.t1